VQALMEQDLLFAEKYLPEKADNVTTLSKVVAQHFLTELYLWENRNEDAVAKGKAAVSNPNYKLITARYGVKKNQPGCAFMDQFLDGNILTSEGNTEALWILPNTTLDNTNGRYPNSMRRTILAPARCRCTDAQNLPFYAARMSRLRIRGGRAQNLPLCAPLPHGGSIKLCV